VGSFTSIGASIAPIPAKQKASAVNILFFPGV